MKGASILKLIFGKRATFAGILLALLAVGICLLALMDVPHGVSRSFAATGVEREPEKPALPGGTVRINEAETDELLQLPGVGETLAAAIQDEIAQHGPFYYPEDLMAVKGIGQRKFQQILPYLNFDQEGD